MAETSDSARELAETLERVNYELARYGKLSQSTQEQLTDSQMKAKYGMESFTKGTKSGADAVAHLAGAAMSAGKAMLDGKKGAAAFNESLDDMSKAATAAGIALTFLIPGGPLIKGVVAGITAVTTATLAYAKAANEMADKLYKGYSGLAKSGAAAADGMTGLYKDAKKLGLSMNELDGFVSLVGENSKDLALFGGTVFDGRKKFADLGAALEGSREEFFRLGMSQEDQNKAIMSYTRLQTQLGRTQGKSTEELAASAKKYLYEMDALAKLTGETREEQEKAREEIRSQERFRAKLLDLEQQGKHKEAKELEDAYLVLRSQNKLAAQGFADIATNNVQTEAAQKSLMGTQGESMRVAQQISEGQIKGIEGVQRVARAHGDTARELGAAMGQIGTYNDTFGDLNADLKLDLFAKNNLEEQYNKIIEDRGKTQNKQGDQLINNQAQLLKTQQDANKAMEDFVFAGIAPAQKAMIKLAEATRDGADKLSEMLGIKKPAGVSAETEAKDKANWAKMTLGEKLESSLAQGIEGAGRVLGSVVGVVSDTAGNAITDLSNKATESRVASESKYLEAQKRGAKPGAAAAAPAAGGAAPAGAAAPAPAPTPTAPPGPGAAAEPNVPASGPGKTPEITDYIKFSGGTGSLEHFMQLQPNVAKSFVRMARDFNNITGGDKLQVNSAFRSPEEQANVNSGTNPKAAPGMSLHQHGRAIDIQSAQVEMLKAKGLLSFHGFKPLEGDPPHIYMAEGGVIPATPGGVDVTAGEAGKNEAFVPLPDGKSIPVSIKGMDSEKLVNTISSLSAKLKILQGDDLVDMARNTSASFQKEVDNIAKRIADATREAMSRGIDVMSATQVKPLQKLQDLANNMLADGGITQGPSIAGEKGPEAVVPLPGNRKIPVQFEAPSAAQLKQVYGDLSGLIPGMQTTDTGWTTELGSVAHQLEMAVQEMISTNAGLRDDMSKRQESGKTMDAAEWMRMMLSTPEGKVFAAQNMIGVQGLGQENDESLKLRQQYQEIESKIRQQDFAAIKAGKVMGGSIEDPLSRMEVLAEDYQERQAKRIERGVGDWQAGNANDERLVEVNQNVLSALQELVREQKNANDISSKILLQSM